MAQPSSTDPSDEFRNAIERDLAALNTLAREQLGERTTTRRVLRDPWAPPDPRPGVPEPEGLPPVGWWIGAAYSDGEPIGRAHQFIGWSPGNGNLGVGCNRFRPGRPIANAFSNEPRLRRGLEQRLMAVPPTDACLKCLEQLARR